MNPADHGMTTTSPDPVAELVGPRTGIDRDDLRRRTQSRWDDERGTGPTWHDLDSHRRAELVRDEASKVLAQYAAGEQALRTARIPVDHHHASSPPYPGAADELAHWRTRITAWLVKELPWLKGWGIRLDGTLNEPATLAVRPGPEPRPEHVDPRFIAPPGYDNPYVRGQVEEAVQLLKLLDGRASRFHAPTGRDELAFWITTQQAHVDQLADAFPGDHDHHARGQILEAGRWLGCLISRQRNLATPSQWRTGGHALVMALNQRDPRLLAPIASEPVPEALLVTALHDGPRDGALRWDAVAALHEYTGATPDDCEHAIRKAVDNGLAQMFGGPKNTRLTGKGSGRYYRLLRALHDEQPTE